MRLSSVVVGAFALATKTSAAESLVAACEDNPAWTFKHATDTYTCAHFANVNVCNSGACTDTPVGSLCGAAFNFPERNCCSCGKAVYEKALKAAQAAEAAAKAAEEAAKEAKAKLSLAPSPNAGADIMGTVQGLAKDGIQLAGDAKQTAGQVKDKATQLAKQAADDSAALSKQAQAKAADLKNQATTTAKEAAEKAMATAGELEKKADDMAIDLKKTATGLSMDLQKDIQDMMKAKTKEDRQAAVKQIEQAGAEIQKEMHDAFQKTKDSLLTSPENDAADATTDTQNAGGSALSTDLSNPSAANASKGVLRVLLYGTIAVLLIGCCFISYKRGMFAKCFGGKRSEGYEIIRDLEDDDVEFDEDLRRSPQESTYAGAKVNEWSYGAVKRMAA